MEWGINKEGCRKRRERDMALLRLAAIRKSEFSKTWVGRQRLQKRNTRIQKKIYVNVLIVGAVILLYICINGKFKSRKVLI